MNVRSQNHLPYSVPLPSRLRILARVTFFFILGVSILQPALAADVAWEYKVAILQGITAGGTIEKESSGVYIDTKRTQLLNKLAADGWEVVAVTGAIGTDHTVYLRRRPR